MYLYLEAEPDIEMGKLDPADEQKLSQFFEEVAGIKADMEVITNILLNLPSTPESGEDQDCSVLKFFELLLYKNIAKVTKIYIFFKKKLNKKMTKGTSISTSYFYIKIWKKVHLLSFNYQLICNVFSHTFNLCNVSANCYWDCNVSF
jgi:hypothetical protein